MRSRTASDLQFHYTSLFSQLLNKFEPILAKSSCMNPEDGELIGLLEIAKMRSKDEKRQKRLETMQRQLELLGMSRWVRGEVSHLGFKLGTRNIKKLKLSSDTTEDSSIVMVDPDGNSGN